MSKNTAFKNNSLPRVTAGCYDIGGAGHHNIYFYVTINGKTVAAQTTGNTGNYIDNVNFRYSN
jgi:hypothetical protein